MQINSLSFNPNIYCNSYSYNSPAFCAKGQPLSLEYIVQKHSGNIPKRVRDYAQELISDGKSAGVSLLEVHRRIYKSLLECNNLSEVKKLYPEFVNVLADVPCQKRSINTAARLTNNFGLLALREYWANLTTKNGLAHLFGMPSRGTLDFSLHKINFVGFPPNYRTLLKASDPVGNKNIADKTKAWNMANPQLRRELNKHAAQGCKTEEYRKAQAQRMYEYDILHPERRQKISQNSQKMWDKCPEVKNAMREFSRKQGSYITLLLAKQANKQHLTKEERIMLNSFFKKFWAAHPEMKKVLAEASNKLKNERY